MATENLMLLVVSLSLTALVLGFDRLQRRHSRLQSQTRDGSVLPPL